MPNQALERTGEVTRQPQFSGNFGGTWGFSGGCVAAGPLSLSLGPKLQNQSVKSMKDQKLAILVGRETSIEEIRLIEGTFGQKFALSVDKGLIRKSTDLLPLAIHFILSATASGLTYDYLKLAIHDFLARVNSVAKRPSYIRIQKNDVYIVISNDNLIFQDRSETREYSSVAKILEDLRNHS